MLDLAGRIWHRLKGNEPFRYESDEPFQYDVQCRVPSTDKARTVLGFEATTSLDDMLDEVVPWVVDAVERGAI